MKQSTKLTTTAAGATTGFGAALACRGVFNAVAVDPAFALLVCVTVGIIAGVAAKRVFTNLLKPEVEQGSEESIIEPPDATL